ncbi:maltose permease [Gymnopilus junonius]|uniref:Maltose permease n=1 Tax=Gymnopilus junonius TaxID=109634 RepID=A0A9P5NEV7_GYMJU|nr:maltose permease [Gymnopilus junonius]
MSAYGIEEELVVANNDQIVRKLDEKVLKDAAKADAAEHQMTLREAFHMNKKAIFWSMALSAALIMEGYDVVVIGSYYGQPNFLRRFGVPTTASENGYVIPAKWQSALSNGSSAGEFSDSYRYGPKVVMMTSLVALTGFIFIMVFCGIPWGVFQTLTTAYASEVCPIHLRGYLTAYVNLCWATLPINSDWSWRLPFVVQWVWIIPLFLVVWFSPESPWWLVRKGRLEEAEENVMRLSNTDIFTHEDAKNTVSMMVHTTELEKQASSGTTYFDTFKKSDRRRTEIVMMVFAMQLLSGENLIGQGVQFLQTAGISTNLAFSLNMILNSMFIIGTIVSWGLLTLFGRRTLYMAGMFIMAVVLAIIGGLGFVKTNTSIMAIGSLLIALNFIYNATLGPICYTLIAEVSSTRLRQKSIVLSRIAYQLMNITCGIIVPRMLSPLSWNWGPKSGLFWAGSAALSTLYCFLRLPETKGRSYGELDLLFENNIPAWRFKGTKVDRTSTFVN